MFVYLICFFLLDGKTENGDKVGESDSRERLVLFMIVTSGNLVFERKCSVLMVLQRCGNLFIPLLLQPGAFYLQDSLYNIKYPSSRRPKTEF
jgi:hypothetical protein